MDENSILLVTFYIENISPVWEPQAYQKESKIQGWVYPENVYYKLEEIEEIVGKYGLFMDILPHPHQRQTWTIVSYSKEKNEALINRIPKLDLDFFLT